jgi:hypothetical protein
VKRSRSGTTSPASRIRGATLLLIAALAVVLAFAGSFIFGLQGRSRVLPDSVSADSVAQAGVVPNVRGRIEVLNAGGKAGLARVATQQLRDAGFDVVQFGNAGKSQPASQVVDRIGNRSIASAAAQVLGITAIISTIDTTRYVDATVILGRDWPLPVVDRSTKD